MPEPEGANRGAAGEMLPRQVLTPGRHSVLVRLTAAPGMRPALLEVLNTYVDTLRHEPGTEMLVVSIDPDDVNNVWLYETFKDDQAQDAHRAADGFAVATATANTVSIAVAAGLGPFRVQEQSLTLRPGCQLLRLAAALGTPAVVAMPQPQRPAMQSL